MSLASDDAPIWRQGDPRPVGLPDTSGGRERLLAATRDVFGIGAANEVQHLFDAFPLDGES